MTKRYPVTLFSAGLALALGQLTAQSQPTPHIALSAGAPTTCPLPPVPGGLPPGDFESPDVPPLQYHYGFELPRGETTWRPWTLTGTSGISANGSGFMLPSTNPPNPVAPSGTRVAFIQGSGSMSAPVTFPVGIWRLRFKAAQRSWNGVNQQSLRVSIAGTEVFEGKPAGAVFEQCTTRAMYFSVLTSAPVVFQGLNTVGDHTAFVDDLLLEPIREWSSNSTWDLGSVPGPGARVEIPEDVEVAMRSACVADTVTVNGELVTAHDAASLAARWVEVSGPGASFEVGRELTPFAPDFTLTLKGTAAGDAAMFAGTKFLMAMDGGRIDMHGLDKKSWSKLTSVNPAGTVIRVTDSTNWAVGDDIVVAYTGHVDHFAGPGSSTYTGPRSRRMQVLSMESNGDITLHDPYDPQPPGPPLNPADHCAATTTNYTSGAQSWTLDQRAEVGMLTRNIKIVGEATPDGQTPFGGHVMIMACCDQMPPGEGRFANVELAEMGQAQVLGRYPLHWHMQRENGAGQYARNCSIYKSYNRAITIHGTHGVEVTDNVCFDIVGHAMFLEDGVETNNTFTGNLVVAIRKPDCAERMLPHDSSMDIVQSRSPAGFWISHPQNTVRNNVVADSLGVGYWFALHTQPTGLSSAFPWNSYFSGNATLASLGEFSGNVAHSLKMGVDVHDSIAINEGFGTCAAIPGFMENGVEDPRNDDVRRNTMWRPSVTAILTGGTMYGCTTGIYTGGGIESIGTIYFRNFVLADNGVHAHMASMDTVEQSVFIRDSGHLIFPTGVAGPANPSGNGMPNGHIQGFQGGYAYVFYDGPARLRQCHFDGYSQIGTSLYFDNFGAARRHTDHRISGLTFAGGLPVVKFEDYSQQTDPMVVDFLTEARTSPHVFGIAVVDEDFSLTAGFAPPSNPPGPRTLITNHPMMHLTSGTGTTPDLLLNAKSPYAWLSPYKWAHLQVRYFTGSMHIPNTNLYSDYGLLEMYNVPKVRFVRQMFSGWQAANIEVKYLPSGQMRQLPVIVLPAGSTEADRVYELVVRNPTAANLDPLRRVDVSIDDFGTADVVRIQITHEALPNWSPTLFVNDDPMYINANGTHPYDLPPLLPPNLGGPPHPGAVTSYQRRILGGIATIDLRLVKPANANRAHRISIAW